MSFICEEEGAQKKNLLNAETVPFDGVLGDYIKIEASNQEILAVCDPQVTVKALDENRLQEIKDAMQICEGYYAGCRDKF
jgi:hypothetical protein